jgi:tetratricopeptide (TPR) repeat protein
MHFSFRPSFLFIVLFALAEGVHAQDDLKLGKEALNQKSYDAAISHFQTALKSTPRSAEINYCLGEAYRLKGVNDSAQVFLERAVDLNDGYVSAMSSLGTLLLKIGQFDKSMKVFAAATKVDKKNADIAIAYGNAFLDIDSLDKAIVYFSKAKEINENLPDIYVGLAEAYGRQNIGVLAISNYQKAAELEPKSAVIRYKLGKAFYKSRLYNDCAREFQEAVNLDPNNDVYVFDVADLFFRAKLWRESARFFAKYVTLKKDNRVAYDEYAKALFGGKFYKDAVPVIEEAMKLNPAVYDLKPMYAYSLYECGEFQKAVDAYKVLPKDSLDAEDYVQIGRSYAKLKDVDNAIASFERVAGLDSLSTEISAELAGLYMGKKMYDKAAAQYSKKLKADPKNIGALINGGVCYMVVGKYDTAKTMMQKTIELRPEFFQAYLYLASCFYRLDSLERAEKQYELVISIIDTVKVEPPDTKEGKFGAQLLEANKFIGLIELLSKNYPTAIDYLKKAIAHETKDKKDAEAHLWLAQSYALSTGNQKITVDEADSLRKKAIEEYEAVLRIDPKNKVAAKELSGLKGG